MNEIAHAAFTEADVQQAVAAMLELEQPDFPVTHHFGPGVYIREVTIPAGTVIIGHSHRNSHLNVMLTGHLTLINMDGTRRELTAPQTLMSKPGRKIAIAHEEVRWQNVYATDETDLEKLEELLFDKAESDMLALANAQLKLLTCDHNADHEDFRAAIAEFGYDEETFWAISSNEDDLIPIPHGSWGYMIGPSPIHGKGVFATISYDPGDFIAPTLVQNHRTPPGRYTNHAAQPNAEMYHVANGDLLMRATRPIAGMKGGHLGDEITVDYRQVLSLQLGDR